MALVINSIDKSGCSSHYSQLNNRGFCCNFRKGSAALLTSQSQISIITPSVTTCDLFPQSVSKQLDDSVNLAIDINTSSSLKHESSVEFLKNNIEVLNIDSAFHSFSGSGRIACLRHHYRLS